MSKKVPVGQFHANRIAESKRSGKPVLVLYIDGGCSGNQQYDINKRSMVAAVTDKDGVVVAEATSTGGSNNVAELWAVVMACEYAIREGYSHVYLFTDSMNNLSWTSPNKLGSNARQSATYVYTSKLKERFHALEQRVHVAMEWVPRDQNKAGHYIEGRYAL